MYDGVCVCALVIFFYFFSCYPFPAMDSSTLLSLLLRHCRRVDIFFFHLEKIANRRGNEHVLNKLVFAEDDTKFGNSTRNIHISYTIVRNAIL